MGGKNSVSDNAPADSDVPESIAEELASLDEAALREVIGYARGLLFERLEPVEVVDEAPGEEIVGIAERDGYTLVTKRQPCASGCGDCPHGPYLYRIRVEPRAGDGEPSLHWSFLGRVEET